MIVRLICLCSAFPPPTKASVFAHGDLMGLIGHGFSSEPFERSALYVVRFFVLPIGRFVGGL